MSNANKPPHREAYFFTNTNERERGTGPAERAKGPFGIGAPDAVAAESDTFMTHTQTQTHERRRWGIMAADERASAFKSPAGPRDR
jgi:hypothetical protein